VLAAMTFRTPREAVELANNTVYGLAACVWSESINVLCMLRRSSKPAWFGLTAQIFSMPPAVSGVIARAGYGREGGRRALEYLDQMVKNAPPFIQRLSDGSAKQLNDLRLPRSTAP